MVVSEHQLSVYIKKAKLKFEDRAKPDILNALKTFTALNPTNRKHKFPDGIERECLCIQGTIPISYRNNVYNIPIALYLLDNHPYSGPYCYVCPTENMQIRVSETVDQQGRIYLPYLTEWQYPTYDTVGLLQVMTISFQEKTPLYASSQPVPPPRTSQPPAPNPPAGYQPPYPQAVATNTPYPTGPINMPQPYSAPQPNQPPYPTASGYQAPYQPYVSMPTPNSVPTGLDQSANSQSSSTPSFNNRSTNVPFSGYSTIQPSHIRASLTSAIEDRLRQRLKEIMGTPYAELQSIDINLQDLRTGNQKLREMIENMEKEQRRLSELKVVYEGKRNELRRVLNESKTSQSEDPNAAIDTVIDATTPLHRQIVHCYVEDCAIDDTIYALGQALKRGTVDLDTYIKYVRELSRKQFIHRATMQKARQLARLPV